MSDAPRMLELAARLQPIPRSITGDGVRETLRVLGERLPLVVHEVPSGTPVLDWTVPPEWNIRAAWIRDPDGRTVVDFRDNPLHVLNYSTPVRARLSLAELRPHLHSLPEKPRLIPYKTSYYKPAWGFCLAHDTLAALPDGAYEVCIDSDLKPGSLTYGEVFLPGQGERELLLTTHVCHPFMANDNLSGLVVAEELAATLAAARGPDGRTPLSFSVRLLFIPGTIGSITWLARNPGAPARIFAGLTLTCLGDAGGFTYKRSRRGDARIDRVVARRLRQSGRAHTLRPFHPYGYDERQFGSPGFNLPVGCLMRTPHGEFPEYHTSADSLTLLRPESLADAVALLREVVHALDTEEVLVNQSPFGEPQLGKRGLYNAPGPEAMALLWVLNFSDGEHSLEDIAERAELPLDTVRQAAAKLHGAGLLARRSG